VNLYRACCTLQVSMRFLITTRLHTGQPD
jgi:hypothetical protein